MAKIPTPRHMPHPGRAAPAVRAGAKARRPGVDPAVAADVPEDGEPALAQIVDSLRQHVDRTGLGKGVTQQVGARLPAGLVREAKRRTGLRSNTDLLTFALASVAVSDDFADAFDRAHGMLDPSLDIGF